MQPFAPSHLLIVAAGPLALGQWLLLGILLIGLGLAFAFWRRRCRQGHRKWQYPPAYRGTAILMHEQATGTTDAAGLAIRELHLAVEVPAHSPRYPVVVLMPIAPVFERLLVVGTRLPVYVNPQNRQQVELDLRAVRTR